MKQITMDWSTYRAELINERNQGYDEGFLRALRSVRSLLNTIEITDGFEVFDCDAYDNKDIKEIISLINELKNKVKT